MKRKIAKKIMALVVAASMVTTGFQVGGMKAEAGYSRSGWNINIYMCGSDLESGGGEATKDIIEILKAKDVPADVDIILETGGAKQWFYADFVKDFYRNDLGMTDETIEKLDVQNIDSDYIQRYRVKYDNYVMQDGQQIQYPSLVCIANNEGISNPDKAAEEGVNATDMGNKDTLADFVKDINSTRAHNVLVLWNHGGGTVGGVCFDDYSGDSLSLVEIDEALSETENYLPRGKYDVIGFDACLMSTFETFVVSARHADYAAASMTLEAGDGWYYTPILESLKQRDDSTYNGASFAKAVADAYEYYYLSDDAKSMDKYDPDAYMGAYDLSKVRPMIAQFDQLAWDLTLIRNDDKLNAKFEKVAYSATPVDVNTDLVGMYSFFKKTIAFAKKWDKSYGNGTDDKSLERKAILEQYVEDATALQKSVFEDDFCLKLVKGAPEGLYPDEEGISFYYPQKDSYDNGNYARYDYDHLGISQYYQTYAYSVAKGISRNQEVKPLTSLVYNKATGKYTFRLLSDNLDYLTFFGQKAYMKRNGKYRLLRYCSKPIEGKTLNLKPLTEYATFNGQPTFMDEVDPDYKDQQMYMCINNDPYTSIYVYKEKGAYYAYGDYGLEVGDVLTPIKIEDGEYTPDKKASYTIKKKDITKDGAVKMPIKMVKDTKRELQNAFVAQNAAGTMTKRTFYHDNVVDFANIKAMLSKTTFKATGKKICPKVTVKMGNKTLKKGKDYKVVYENNLGAGTAKAIISGIGKYKYAPEKVLTYKIKVNNNRKTVTIY